MTDSDMTGPWALALGTLAIGVGAIGAELLRQRRDDEGTESAADRASGASRGDRTSVDTRE